MSSERLVIIFIRNVQIGKVKKQLADTVGDENALNIYIHLLNRVAEVTQEIKAHKAVFYSEYIEEADEFMVPVFQKYIQQGKEIGERMKNAFIKGFSRGYKNIVMISSDCYELTAKTVDDAFNQLTKNDVVIGPSTNAGYYLIGMKQLHKPFFTDKDWSGNNVLVDTLLDANKKRLSYALLPTLNKIIAEEDLTPDLKKVLKPWED
ncbi:MAG TPA: TIGR04282 family arsenosugar biosynthesis glycosyltransferase [Flavobacteriales bacterium]|nr:TIGR04282 family arsenosugar biosynthesis glycosyltransferase [Flavobacteriales bacterium]